MCLNCVFQPKHDSILFISHMVGNVEKNSYFIVKDPFIYIFWGGHLFESVPKVRGVRDISNSLQFMLHTKI